MKDDVHFTSCDPDGYKFILDRYKNATGYAVPCKGSIKNIVKTGMCVFKFLKDDGLRELLIHASFMVSIIVSLFLIDSTPLSRFIIASSLIMSFNGSYFSSFTVIFISLTAAFFSDVLISFILLGYKKAAVILNDYELSGESTAVTFRRTKRSRSGKFTK